MSTQPHTPSNTPIHRAQVAGAIMALVAAAGMVLAIVLPMSFKSFVQVCGVTQNDPSAYSVGGSAKCTAETFVVQYQWAFLVLAGIFLVTGLILTFFGNRQDIREEFDMD